MTLSRFKQLFFSYFNIFFFSLGSPPLMFFICYSFVSYCQAPHMKTKQGWKREREREDDESSLPLFYCTHRSIINIRSYGDIILISTFYSIELTNKKHNNKKTIRHSKDILNTSSLSLPNDPQNQLKITFWFFLISI